MKFIAFVAVAIVLFTAGCTANAEDTSQTVQVAPSETAVESGGIPNMVTETETVMEEAATGVATEIVAALQAQATDVPEVTAIPANDETPTVTPITARMPLITEDHQGFVYHPGQLVTVIAEGFSPDDVLLVSIAHEEKGVLQNYTVSPVNPYGYMPIFFPVNEDEAAYYPDGNYTMRVKGTDGTVKEYTFALDFLHLPEPADFGCGIYPQPALGGDAIAWCTGFEPFSDPPPVRAVVNGEELFSDVADFVYGDGVALYSMAFFDDDPPGEWTFEFGNQSFVFTVEDVP